MGISQINITDTIVVRDYKFPHLPVHKLRIGANYRMIHAVSKLVKYTKHWVLFVMLLFSSIYRLIYIFLKKEKPVNIRQTAFMEIKKTHTDRYIGSRCWPASFLSCFVWGFFLIRWFRLRLKLGFRIKAFTLW